MMRLADHTEAAESIEGCGDGWQHIASSGGHLPSLQFEGGATTCSRAFVSLI